MYGRNKRSKLEGLLNSVGQSDLSVSDAPHQLLLLPHCLICSESSVLPKSAEVCQNSLFRVKFIFSSSFSRSAMSVCVSPRRLPPSTCSSFMMLQIQTCNSRQDLRLTLMGDGAHLLNMLPITASLALCPDSKLEI